MIIPKRNRKLPIGKWRVSVAGGFLSSYFCIRKLKDIEYED